LPVNATVCWWATADQAVDNLLSESAGAVPSGGMDDNGRMDPGANDPSDVSSRGYAGSR
jgi:hypothetical protein